MAPRKKKGNVAALHPTTKLLVTNVIGIFLVVTGMLGLFAPDPLAPLVILLFVGFYVLGYSFSDRSKAEAKKPKKKKAASATTSKSKKS